MSRRPIGTPAHPARRMGLPEPTQRPAQTIEWRLDLPELPVGPLAPVLEQEATGLPQRWRKHGQQRTVGQRHQQEQFALRLPGAQAQRVDEQFAFLKAETFFNLPATGVGEDHLPGLRDGLDRLIGEQIPRLAPATLAHHHQPQRALILGMSYRESQHARTAIDPAMRVPELSGLSPWALAPGDLPGFALAALRINEFMAFLESRTTKRRR